MPSRSGLPLGSMSSSPAARTVFGASRPSAGRPGRPPAVNRRDAFGGAVGHGDVGGHGLAPLGGRHAGNKGRRTPSSFSSSACTCAAETLTPPVMMTSSARPSTVSRPSASSSPRSLVRYQRTPSSSKKSSAVGSGGVRGSRRRRWRRPAGCGRPRRRRTCDALEREAVVHAAAAGLRGAVGGDHAHAGVTGRVEQLRRSAGPPPSRMRVEAAQHGQRFGRRVRPAAAAAGWAPAT